MPIPLHLTFVTVLGVVGFLGGAALGILTADQMGDALPEVLSNDLARLVLFCMVPALLGSVMLRGAFTRLVHATCPRCGGPMTHRDSRRERAVFGGATTVPVTYTCRACGHVHVTKVSAPDRDHIL